MRLVPLFILIPFITAVIISLFNRVNRKIIDWIAVFATFVSVIVSSLMLMRINSSGPIVYNVAGWIPPVGINFVVDGLSVFMLLLVSVLSFLFILYSMDYMNQFENKWQYYVLFLLAVTGMNGVLLSGDLFNLFIFFEITSISSYALVSFSCESDSFEAAFKYIIFGVITSVCILLAIALIYAKTSTLNLAYISQSLDRSNSLSIMFILFLIILGVSIKTALVPFHAWLPDTYTAAPAPVSALLSGLISKTLGIYVIIRIFYNVIGVNQTILSIFTYLGIFSMVIAVILALYQWDFKRLLAYHSISQIGYIILGLGLGTPLGILGGLFHLINHSVFKSLLFLNAGSVEKSTGIRSLKDLGGLSRQMPVTAATSMVASMSISGIPPFNGFWSKLIIIAACIESGHYWFALIAVLVSILTLSSFLKVQRYVFSGYLKNLMETVRESPLSMTIPMIILSIFCIFMGLLLLPGLDSGYLKLAVNTVLQGTDYAKFVIGK